MELPPEPRKSQPKLADLIKEAGLTAFHPNTAKSAEKFAAEKEFNRLIDDAPTWPLMHALNALIKPDVVPQWLGDKILPLLMLLPLRKDGVRATIEFVFTVHPSSNSLDSASRPENSGSRAASITSEALLLACHILFVPPTFQDIDEWFSTIQSQIFPLLDGEDGPELVKVAAQLICWGVLSKKSLGAPKAPGWVYFVEPIIKYINPSVETSNVIIPLKEPSETIVDLSHDRVLVDADTLVLAIRRLSAILLSSPFPAQCRRLVSPIFAQLWTLGSWPNPDEKMQEQICQPCRALLEAFLKLISAPSVILSLVHNLGYHGGKVFGDQQWKFRTSVDSRVEIIVPRQPAQQGLDLEAIAKKSDQLVSLLLSACTKEDISVFFLGLFRRWLVANSATLNKAVLITQADNLQQADSFDAALKKVTETFALQKLMERAPEKLIGQFQELVDLVGEVLGSSGTIHHDEEVMAVVLSLLNLIVTAPGFKKSQLKPDVLDTIEQSLEKLGRGKDNQIAPTARNLAILLKFRDELDQEEAPQTTLNDRQKEDRKTYSLAIGYITEADSPPPVKSEGLNLLSSLILSGSAALDIPAVLVLLSTLIKENDDFLNLRVIKTYTQIAARHPKTAVGELVDQYVDSKETLATDTRLRFGEALLQVIERLGEMFTGDVAAKAGPGLLFIAGRRAYRPKTEKKQAREEKIRKRKNQEAEEVWDGNVLDLSDDMPESQKEQIEVFAQIVEGWESKRGSEDVRMRASAVSIFAAAIETNLAGLGATLVNDAIEMCIKILAMEGELEKAILRRAAILLILSFVKTLDQARQDKKRLGYSLSDNNRVEILRILEYISHTDNDGMVRQHAETVTESLNNWHISRFLPTDGDTGRQPEMTRLVGINVNPLATLSAEPAPGSFRPKIEEVE